MTQTVKAGILQRLADRWISTVSESDSDARCSRSLWIVLLQAHHHILSHFVPINESKHLDGKGKPPTTFHLPLQDGTVYYVIVRGLNLGFYAADRVAAFAYNYKSPPIILAVESTAIGSRLTADWIPPIDPETRQVCQRLGCRALRAWMRAWRNFKRRLLAQRNCAIACEFVKTRLSTLSKLKEAKGNEYYVRAHRQQSASKLGIALSQVPCSGPVSLPAMGVRYISGDSVEDVGGGGAGELVAYLGDPCCGDRSLPLWSCKSSVFSCETRHARSPSSCEHQSRTISHDLSDWGWQMIEECGCSGQCNNTAPHSVMNHLS